MHSAADREAVASALNMLTHIVLRMADTWFSARRISGWVNLKLFEQQNRALFDGSHFVFSDNPALTLQEDMKSETIAKGLPFPATFSEHFGTVVKHNVFGELPVSDVAPRGRLQAIYLVNAVSTLIGLSPDATVDLNGFDDFQVLLFIRGRNASAPKVHVSAMTPLKKHIWIA